MPFPLVPPRSWFETPEAREPTPLTFEKTGRVYGHLALWDACHRGFLNGKYSECVQPPSSHTNYGQFHLGPLETDGGDVMVGKLTYDTGHAPINVGMQAAIEHYDHTGRIGAYVRAVDGQYGIWLSGAVKSDLTPEQFRDLRANQPSGDWRMLRDNLELIASLSVTVPGFPIAQSQLALAASVDGDLVVSALILPGYTEPEPVQERSRAYLRQRAAITASLEQ